ncbi:MAG: M14 family zinc carboxypeptidase [Nocardioides sp.]
MLRRFSVLCALALLAPLALLAGAGNARPAPDDAAKIYVLRVSTPRTLAAAERLQAKGYDVLEARVGRDLLVLGDARTRRKLAADGFRSRVYQDLSAAQAGGTRALFFGGYKSADEYLQTLDDTVAAFPGLAVTYDIGDSYLKTQNAATGNDIKVICLTQQQPGDCQLTPSSTKPRFFLMATVHARELSATEVADRFIAELTTAYGTNAEITALLRNTEVWVLPLANPDGREIAEPGTPTPYLQRKNANASAGGPCAVPPTASNQSGVDINRNHTFLWGGVGTSTDPCAQTYRGTAAGSEPETQALESLMTALFADQRGPNITDAAPSTTVGAMTTLHSYGNLVLFPWGQTNTASPNDAGLRSMGFRMNWYNGYTAGQPGQVLYNVSGASDDWAYGTLGIAASTVEIGASSGSCGGFVPPYSCQAGLYTTNRGALLYAAKLAREPYTLSRGPNTHTASATPATVAAGTSVTLGARGQDSAYGTSGVSRPASQRINAAQYFVDTPPWAGGTPVAMSATDGSFNSSSELIGATMPTTGLSVGQHVVYLRSRDASNTWGPVTAVFVNIT